MTTEEIQLPRRRLLEVHGTTIMKLKPSSIWAAAMKDLERHDRNRIAGIEDVSHFAFHRKHVQGAESANDIIRAALADPEPGLNSGKEMTRLIYSDLELLARALA